MSKAAWIIPLLLICLTPSADGIAADIEIEGRRVTIDTEKGSVTIEGSAIVSVKNKLTGEVYADGAAPMNLAGLLWKNASAYLDSTTPLKLTRTGSESVAITAEPGEGHRLTTRVSVDPDTGDIVLKQSGISKRAGLYACQWGIGGISSRDYHALVPGYSGVRLDSRTPAYDLKFKYPMSWEVQMAVVEGDRGGFAVWSEDAQFHFKLLHWRRKGDKFSLAFQSHNFAPFDELKSVESVEWRLMFFKGDWRVPAKRYRDWMEKTYGLTRIEKQRPAWVKDIKFLVIAGMDEKLLDALAEHVPPEATLLYIPHWRRDRYDFNYPDYTAHENFPDFVRKAHSLGFHVMPHMNYFGCDPKNPAYERFKRWQMRDPITDELRWWIPPLQRNTEGEPSIKFAYINPASKEWRDELTKRLVEAYRKYGFDAIHLDQTLCIINDANGRIDGNYCPQGNILLHKQLREAMPDVALSGEGLSEITCRYEAFAQRHAPRAVDPVHRVWNDEFIACGHPISSYFLTPYTTIYGYLGMTSPTNRRVFLAWKRAYENWGVIPTLARPCVAMLANQSGATRALLREARLWVRDGLAPDFEGRFDEKTKFRLKGENGVAAVYERDEYGSSRMLRITPERTEIVYAIVKGRNSIEGTGTIPDWFAYDERKIFGLNPEMEYVYLPDRRNNNVAHIYRAPENCTVRVLMRDENKFQAELSPLLDMGGYDFTKRIHEAETGIIVDGRASELDYGATFNATWFRCGGVMKRGIYAHPPYKIRAKGAEPAQTFGCFTVNLPSEARAYLGFSIGLRDGTLGRSDGVEFRVLINENIIFKEVYAKNEWKKLKLPLDKWRGKRVRITFVTTPSPSHNASFDWACWGEPRVLLEPKPRRGEITFASPRPVSSIVSPDARMKWRMTERRDGLYFYDVDMRMPDRIIFLWREPKRVSLPLDLAAEPFSLSFCVNDAPAKPPLRYAGAKQGTASSGGVKRAGINAHPPDFGRTSIDYVLQLPEKESISLEFAVGLRDGAKSEGVVFVVEVNGAEVFKKLVTAPDGWHSARVDLSRFSGKTILLSLVVDADGSYYYDWATWAQPVLK